MSQPETDLQLLRRFEPVIRYNAGERFFPMSVEAYVRECGLYVQRKGEAPEAIIPEEELTLGNLPGQQADEFDEMMYLKFISPLNVAEMAQYNLQTSFQRKDPRDVFHAGTGRLARVGFGSRLLDALFSLSLFARGRVPGDTAIAAVRTYQRIMQADSHHSYYGRVVRQDHWIALQYWFFYAYNNWRSGFFGVNDHESDWEQICLYCYETEGGDIQPEWVAYASHDFSGDDLRRRWDDPEIDKVGEHPVIYAGAGSHASYYQGGEYLTEIEIPFLKPLVQLVDQFDKARQKAIARTYQGEQMEQHASASVNIFRIPFVDYARGDGHAVGPDQEQPWTQIHVIEPPPAWVEHYRGLWGLYAHDPLSGEDAPAGPMYNRDGSVRRAWYDPLGWAGLDKAAPPRYALAQLEDQKSQISERMKKIERGIEGLSAKLRQLGLEADVMRDSPHLKQEYADHQERISSLSKSISKIRASLTRDTALLDALQRRITHIQQGDKGPLRAHIKKAHHPISSSERQIGRIAEWWAAASIGLMLIAFVLVVVFQRESILAALGGMLTLFIVLEAAFRRQFGQLITSITLVLAVLAAVILLVNFFWPIAIVAVLAVGGYILWDNLSELWR
jgi:hypothetical protein